MGISLRCFLACILPCGALDLIRIVHSNGYVQELTGRVTAGEILKNYPDHALSKPTAAGGGASSRIMIISPDSDLKRGSIYFLVPSSSLPVHEKRKQRPHKSSKHRNVTAAAEKKRHRRRVAAGDWRPDLDSISEDFLL